MAPEKKTRRPHYFAVLQVVLQLLILIRPGHRAAALLAGLCLLGCDARREDVFVYASYLPSTHTVNKSLAALFSRLEGVEGRRWRLLEGGVLGHSGEMLTAVGDGVVDAALLIDAMTPYALPASVLVSDLTMLGEDAAVMAGAANETFLLDCAECREELKRRGVVPLAYYSTTPYVLICRDEAPDLEDMRGLKVRSTITTADLLLQMGAVPVNIQSSEIYEGLQRGQIECTVGPDAWLRSYNLWDVANYVVEAPFGTYHGGLVFNMRADLWAKLPSAYRKRLLAEMPEFIADVTMGYIEDSKRARALAAEHGVVFSPADPALLQRIADYAQNSRKQVVLYAPEKVRDPEMIVDQFVDNIDKWKTLVSSNVDKKKLRSALASEVYFHLEDEGDD